MKRIGLQGDLPNPANPSSGCPFHTRCPIAQEVCKIDKSAWEEMEPGHFAGTKI